MSFINYLDKINRLDEMESVIRSNGSDKIVLDRISAIRDRYEIKIIESGDYPRGV